MHDIWSIIILGNPLRSYIIVAITILFIIALKRFISRWIARLIFRMVRRMDAGLDKSAFMDLVVGPIGTFIVLFVSLTSIEKLHFPAELDFDLYEVKAKTIIQGVAVIILISAFSGCCSGWWILSRWYCVPRPGRTAATGTTR